MARRRTRRSEREKDVDIIEETVGVEESSMQEKVGISRKIPFSVWILGLVIIVLGFLLYKNKDLVVAGMVNNKPIFSWELNSRLKQRFGQQVLDEMVSERLVLGEAGRKKITVSEKELNEKIAEVEKSLGQQVTLSQALQQQGITMADFRKQIELRIIVERLLQSKVTVSEGEVEKYLSENKESIEAFAGTDSAKQRRYATDTLKRQKTGDEFEKWFSDLKSKAKVSIFLRP